MPIIEVKNISKKYQINDSPSGNALLRDRLINILKNPIRIFKKKKVEDFWALKDISFNIEKGEILGIIGLNGAGKSTLLKIMSQVTEPTSGEAIIRGRVASLLEVGTGFHPELTGRENIYLNGSIIGMKKAEIDNYFNDIVKFSEIEKFLDTPVKRYSSGMFVRLAFSVAAHLNTDILLIDEILAVGDMGFQKKCMNKIGEISGNSRRTIILVSHDMSTISRICNNCILIDKGKLIAIGTTQEIIDIYEKKYIKNININDRLDRKGNGNFKIVDIILKDNKGNDIKYLKCGDDCQLWFAYKVFDPHLKKINFSLAIESISNKCRVVYLDNKILNEDIYVEKSGFIKIKISRLPLNVGEYDLTVYVDSSFGLLDWIKNAKRFRVLFGDFYKTGYVQPEDKKANVLLDYSFI